MESARRYRVPFMVLGFCLMIGGPSAASPLTFSNTAAISIPAFGNGSPYPSQISASGLTGVIVDVTVTLVGFSHGFPDDVGAMLVSPSGAGITLFDGGTVLPATNVTLTFANGGAPWPTAALGSGTYQPTSLYTGDTFPAPAPTIGGVNPTTIGPKSFSVFDGANPNGVWSLFVRDFINLDSGSIAGGWSLTITTDAQVPVPEPATLILVGLGTVALVGRRWREMKSRPA